MTHICISKLTIIGSDNGLSPGRRLSHYLNQWRNIVNWTLKKKLQWNFNQNSKFSFKKIQLKMTSVKWRPFCLSLIVLTSGPNEQLEPCSQYQGAVSIRAAQLSFRPGDYLPLYFGLNFRNPSYIYIRACCIIYICSLYHSVHKFTINNPILCIIGVQIFNWKYWFDNLSGHLLRPSED